MTCEKCREYEDDPTTHFSVLEEKLELNDRSFEFTTASGTAKCGFCGQAIEYFSA